jgi:cobalamin synthase
MHVDEAQAKIDAVKGIFDFKTFIPLPFQSWQNFNNTYAIYPALAVFLVIQLVGVYTAAQHQNAAAMAVADGKTVEQVTR